MPDQSSADRHDAAARPPLAPDPNDFWSFTQFATLLPGVKPHSSLAALRDAHMEATLNDAQTVQLQAANGALSVSVDEMGELFCANDWGSPRVSPKGAALLVRLYEAGALDMKTKKRGAVPPEALAYIASDAELMAKATSRHEQREARAAKVESPETVGEADFTFGLLNDIFWRHKGAGAGEMLVGGVLVSKSVARYTSNSGKTRDFHVEYSWVGANGQHHVLTKASAHENNRRNDPDRNWGLPE